ncbi:glycosyltransferase family 4 protein [Sediminibacterium roseum]|uniref:Glycosyltransferase family 4 protein n=1 Tax=Sediminibacterium roseum TaxID=1978412 RepID=A0ABW9ZW47_9BACT|nr:glycosyltransferase [Sediminibacterium roseum]NCI49101.1 glycosyltransferase family 4 protein [Sediminibacterium roseum]
MTSTKFILVGARQDKHNKKHPGGVLTLSAGLIDYATAHGFEIEVIDTYRSSFDKSISFIDNMKQGLRRIKSLVRLFRNESFAGVIIFSGAGVGFYERIVMSLVCRWYKTRDLFVIVDGWFLQVEKAGFFKRSVVKLLLKIPYKLGASGKNWARFFRSLEVPDHKILEVKYWLPASFTVAAVPKTALPQKPLKFIFIGWMIREKGLNEIIGSISALYNKYPFSFVLIGGGTMLEEVRTVITTQHWEERVSALGWVDDAKFEKEISSSDIFVLPSYAEGFPMSLIEAMSKGLPAICSNVGGISDSVIHKENGYLVTPRSTEELIRGMTYYLESPDLRLEQHSRKTLDIVKQNHDCETNCRLYFDTFR